MLQVFSNGEEYIVDKTANLQSLVVEKSSKEDDDDLIDQTLRDYYDVQIFTRVLIGSDKESFDMIFDTGSNWLWVYTDECTNCPNSIKTYDPNESDTYKDLNEEVPLHYGSGSIYGERAKEQVCLTEDSCVSDFKMLMANEQSGLDRLATSGIVGLSPNHYEQRADLFIEKMKKAGVIDERVFSISIAMGTKQSYITFGGYNLSKYA